MPDATSGVEKLVLPSELKALERVDAATLRYSELAGFDESMASMVAMAVIEAVTNAVIHGNRQSRDKTVALEYEWKPGEIKVTVHDQGEGFDLTCLLDPTDPERCMECSGRGIYIMREIMDTVEFDMSQNSGTTVTMTKMQ